MRQADNVSSLVEEIYDAALEPALWSNLVVSINAFVGTRACGIISKDSTTRSGVTHYHCGVDPHYIQLYADTYCRFDPLARLPGFGKVVSIPDLVCFDDYVRGPFYQEWLRPQGSADVGNVVLERTDVNCPVLLTFLSGKRMMDKSMRRRIERLVPHAHRAITINKAIQTERSQADGFEALFDEISTAVFLIGNDCEAVNVNSAAQQLLEDGCIRLRGGQLVASDKRINQMLRDTFCKNENHSQTNVVQFCLKAQDGSLYSAQILPLHSSERGSFGRKHKALGALFVRKVKVRFQPGVELIAQAFELTPAETRVLSGILEIGGVPGVSSSLQIAETTVKTHLQRVFAKTGASRQTDLVKLGASFSTSLAN